MKLSSKSRYGLKAMIDLGLNFNRETLSVKTIALRHDISESYLEQIIAKLKENKLVRSIQGAHGGYSLAKEPSKISLGDILRALEGDLNVVNCSALGCESLEDCTFKYIWQKVSDGISKVVDNMTLKEIIEDNEKIKKLKEIA